MISDASLLLEHNRLFLFDAYAKNGIGVEAIELYGKMSEHTRDAISHVCVLNACSHSGLADQARAIFNEIKNKTEKMYTVMVYVYSH